MKKIILILVLVSIASCKKEIVENTKPITKISNEKEFKHAYGNWVGHFIADSIDELVVDDNYNYSNKINIVIKKIENNKVFGKSIVSGNERPFSGTVKKDGKALFFNLIEPGDDKYDGKFSFKIENNKLVGKWFANDKKATVFVRKYDLEKQEFKYNPNLMLTDEDEYVDWYSSKLDTVNEEIDGVTETYYNEMFRTASDVVTKINASTTKLTENDIKNLKKLELEIIRNTIFARHGYSFKKKSFRQFFDYVNWYIPVSNNVDKELTQIEKDNILLLNRFEKYAIDNYDTFGR